MMGLIGRDVLGRLGAARKLELDPVRDTGTGVGVCAPAPRSIMLEELLRMPGCLGSTGATGETGMVRALLPIGGSGVLCALPGRLLRIECSCREGSKGVE